MQEVESGAAREVGEETPRGGSKKGEERRNGKEACCYVKGGEG